MYNRTEVSTLKLFRVQGMSATQLDMSKTLQDKSVPLLIHLAYYSESSSDNINLSHWAKEIYSFINTVPKLKSNNKFPSELFIYRNIYRTYFDCLQDWLPGEFAKEDIQYEPSRLRIIEDFCSEYCEWLSIKLSVHGKVTQSEVINELNYLKEEVFA